MALEKFSLKYGNACRERIAALLLRNALFTFFVFIVATASAQVFVDVADSLNVSAVPNSLQYGSGMSFYDFNEDGWDDLSFTMVDDSLIFYQNQGGTFQRLSSFLYGAGKVKHLVWVDYDNDGDMDIGLTTFENRYSLYQNDGNFNFTNVSVEAGLLQASERYYGISFADYDRDGYLDFYVTCYEQLGDESDFSRLNHLYHNNGDGTFTNVTNEAGVGDGIKLSFKGVWFDYNMDGWPDLFVINDRVFENSLYRNNGDGTFTDVSEEAGIQLGGQDPMTATVGDFDNDGDLDIFMTNTNSPFKRGQLLVNNGDGTFTQMAEEYGVDVFGWTWGAVWIDFDNDSDQDLFVAHGHPNLQIFESPDFLLENFDGEFFFEVGLQDMAGDSNRRSYSVTRGDFNNDGYYDMAVLNRAPDDVNLWQNAGGSNRYIKITLTGTASNRKAIGSWIRVYIGGHQYTQYTMCGENYIGQNSQHHIFGLGSAEAVDSVEVEYVLGHTDTYYSLESNLHYYFTEGETYSAEITASGPLVFCEGDSVVLDAGEHENYLWTTGDTTRTITVFEPGEIAVETSNEFGISAVSDTLQIEIYDMPNIDVITENPACSDSQDGSITLVNLSGVPADEVIWGETAGSVLQDSLPGGTYSYTFTDVNGCTAEGTVLLTAPQPLAAIISTSPEINGSDGEINVFVNGGTPPYSVLLNGEDALLINGNLSGGQYFVQVFDANDCQFSAEVEVEILTNAMGIAVSDISVFPNPVRSGEQLQLISSLRLADANIRITDLAGKAVFKSSLDIINSGVNEIPLNNLRPGAYLFQLISADQVLFVTKLIHL